ncbi:WG repeat-containing protein [Sphingobacterium allocomposti]|nr:WG repeat-containing protein [Sphingobacterium composti Yoo et al. 2007 non Ten et al. 2007]
MINTKGDTVLQPIYDRIDDFKDSIALVYKDGRAFYIDRQGNEVAYDPKKHPNQKPLDPHISKRIKYIDSWESLLKD